MKVFQRILVLIVLFAASSLTAVAQKKGKMKFSFGPEYKAIEDSIEKAAFKLVNDSDEEVRKGNGFQVIKYLVRSFKMANSFYYPFDSVKSIGIITPKDQRFRIFTWHYKANDENYRYYGVIQMNVKGKPVYYPFFDFSESILHPEDTVLTNKGWYGAHYYTIVEKKIKGEKYYFLLGWKGYSQRSSKKVIDVLSFDDNDLPVFGAEPFLEDPTIDDEKKKDEINRKVLRRVVFEFNGDANMLLRWLPKEKMIIFDHLIPLNESGKGFYEAYVPDLTYDALKFKSGKWKYKENVQLKNPPSPQDRNFNDPLK